jgi:hypothetical protein
MPDLSRIKTIVIVMMENHCGFMKDFGVGGILKVGLSWSLGGRPGREFKLGLW